MRAVATLHPHLSRLLALLSLTLALAILLYATLLLSAVSHTAARASAEREMQALSSKISTLEGAYFEATRTVTPELAAELGFVPPTSTVVVFADAERGALTLEGSRE
jgi:hypothetical protein